MRLVAVMMAFLALTLTVSFAQQETSSQNSSKSLLVEVVGLPADKEVEIWVVNNDSKRKFTLHSSTSKATVIKVPPGKYVITAFNATAEGKTYMPANFDPSNIVSVDGGESLTVSVTYEQAGHLQLSASNLPPSLSGKLEIISPSRKKITLCPSVGTVLNLPLLPGLYIITPKSVSDGKITYVAPRSRVTLDSGELINFVAEYEESRTAEEAASSSDC